MIKIATNGKDVKNWKRDVLEPESMKERGKEHERYGTGPSVSCVEA